MTNQGKSEESDAAVELLVDFVEHVLGRLKDRLGDDDALVASSKLQVLDNREVQQSYLCLSGEARTHLQDLCLSKTRSRVERLEKAGVLNSSHITHNGFKLAMLLDVLLTGCETLQPSRKQIVNESRRFTQEMRRQTTDMSVSVPLLNFATSAIPCDMGKLFRIDSFGDSEKSEALPFSRHLESHVFCGIKYRLSTSYEHDKSEPRDFEFGVQ